MMLSTITRNSAAAVVGTLMWALFMQLLGVLPGTEPIRPYLLGTQFNAWNGFLRTPTDWVPIVRALWVCAFYAGIPLVVGYVVFLRRDVAANSRDVRPRVPGTVPGHVRFGGSAVAGQERAADDRRLGAGRRERVDVLG